jgi:2-haloacid dehalogenase
MNRRLFTRHVAGAAAGTALLPNVLRALGRRAMHPGGDAPAAVLFDALVLFDTRPVAFVAEQVFPGHGAELMTAWRARQFEYAWLRVVARNYADFWRCTEDSLRYAAGTLALQLGPTQRDRLMGAYLALHPWPDVPPALQALRNAGLRLGVLSNFSPAMLDASVRNGALGGTFEHLLSTDVVRTYKPAPSAYQMGLDALRLPRERILFVAFAGWDAAGAKQFGYPTFWVNRLQSPAEELGAPAPDGSGRSLTDLLLFLGSRGPA